MKIKDLEDAINYYQYQLMTGVDEATGEWGLSKHFEAFRESAKTMLELMKAREKASKGTWDLNGTMPEKPEYSVFVKWGNKFATLFKISIPEYHENKNKGWEEAHRNAQFITEAANLTRES